MDKFTVTVRQARILSNISAKEMAKFLGLSHNAYLLKEKGKSRFYYDEAIKFSSIVNIPVDNILFVSDVA